MNTPDFLIQSRSRFTHSRLGVAAALLLGALATGAQETHAATVITSAPFEITQSGDYVLGANLVLNQKLGAIITVSASNVTLDFANHFIAGPTNIPGAFVTGIFASERSNLTVKNGTIAFCAQGMDIVGNGSAKTNNVGIRVENMRVTKCSIYGIFLAEAPGAVVRRCQITSIRNAGAGSQATGIFLSGDGASVVDCAIGEIVANAQDSTYGIFLSKGAFAARNCIADAPVGIAGSGKAQDNLFQAVTKPLFEVVDAGGNN